MSSQPWDEPTWDHARALAASAFSPLPTVRIPIAIASGRVLAEDCYSLSKLPFYETSAMDGWVVRGEQPWKIVGEIATGFMPTIALRESECARIGTGGIIPEGATAVIRWEDANEHDGHILGQASPGKDIRPAGFECEEGELLATAGTLLQPAIVGNLAGSGIDTVLVSHRARVGILLLGDELIHEGLPHDGKIRDSLGVQLPSLFSLLGTDVITHRFIKDDYDSLVLAVQELIEQVDIIVTTGGTADGRKDHVHPLLQELNATYVVNKIKARPGHPMLLASVAAGDNRNVALLGLPGNPQSALAAITTLGIPLINSLHGKSSIDPLPLYETSEPLEAQPDFNRLIAGNLVDGKFHPARKIGSNMLRGLALSTGFAVCNPGVTPAGGLVRWLELPHF